MTSTGTLIANNATLSLGGQDFSPHVVSVDISGDAGVIDVGTFANPYRQAIGRPQYNIVATFIWSETFYTLLGTAGGPDADIAMIYTPNTAAGSAVDGNLAGTVRFGAYPYGTFKVGEKVEVDIKFAVAGDLTWTASTDA